MKYKWCICDMDGTLLNSEDMISAEDEAALKQLMQEGVEVMIASGRVDQMVMRYIHQLGLKGYVISCNGSLIRNVHTGEILYSKGMDKSIVRELLTYALNKQIDFLVYTPQVMFSNLDNPRAAKYGSIPKNMLGELKFEARYIETLDMTVMEGMDILKVLFILPTQEQVDYHLNMYSELKELEVVSSAPGLLDIMAVGSSKGTALKILADSQEIDLKEVIAFGDNYNDIEMLQCAGLPIAMENAVEELKALAKHITKSNNDSGIAYAVENFIFSE